MKALLKRLESLEGRSPGDLDALSDEDLDERCIVCLERIEALGVEMPPHWRDLDLLTALQRVGGNLEAML